MHNVLKCALCGTMADDMVCHEGCEHLIRRSCLESLPFQNCPTCSAPIVNPIAANKLGESLLNVYKSLGNMKSNVMKMLFEYDKIEPEPEEAKEDSPRSDEL